MDTEDLSGRLERLPPAQKAALRARLLQARLRGAPPPVPPPTASGDTIGPAPASFAQERMWFLTQFDSTGYAYNVLLTYLIEGELDVARLRGAMETVVHRHGALRTVFSEGESHPLQHVLPAFGVDLPVIELSPARGDDPLDAAMGLAVKESRRPFDLGQGPLFRVFLVRLGHGRHLFGLVVHHIICDAWSRGILVRELSAAYNAIGLDASGEVLAGAVPQYVDYARWQRQWLQGKELERQLDYWREQLRGIPPRLSLPADRARPPVQTYRGARHFFDFPSRLADGLRDLARSEDASPFMALLAAFKVLLWRYSGQTDIVVGSPIANRNRRETEGVFGLFVNTLVLRTDLSGDPTYRQLLGRVRDTALGAYSHQDLPFEKLVEVLQPERSLNHHPLFQVMLTLENTPGEGLALSGLKSRWVMAEEGVGRFDLDLYIEQHGRELRGVVAYSADLFRAETIARLAERFKVLLRAVVTDPDRPISELPFHPDTETWAMREWNETRTRHPAADMTLHDLIGHRAVETPDASAVVTSAGKMTYKALEEKAEALAGCLRALGVGPEVVVGVCLERSEAMIAALLGVLRAGGAYLPLDPEYPAERLRFMVEDSGAAAVVTSETLAELFHGVSRGALQGVSQDIPLIIEPWVSGPESRPREGPSPGPDNLAYVIYTSGSTGTPKAVMCTHRGVVNHLLWLWREYALGPGDAVLQKTPLSFDVSVREIFHPLSVGGRIVVADPGAHRDPRQLMSMVREHDVRFLNFVPSMLRVFVEQEGASEACASVRTVVLGGETLDADLLRRARDVFGAAEIRNHYGPTEATIGVTSWKGDREPDGPTVPIGRPISNARVYVMDESLRPVPPDIPGELYIGGAALARGYLGRADLTAERFVPDPAATEPGDRLYRTGDLARFRADGELEFLGRNDDQVKLRGFRIELGEIEAVLRAHPEVREAAVVLREDLPGERGLTAYFVAASANRDRPGAGGPALAGPALAEFAAGLRQFLLRRLPEHMIPSAWVSLKALPLSRSGKLDRRSLPAPEGTGLEDVRAYAAPRTRTEEIIAAIWAETLRSDQVGIGDSFFDLGGHSLLATRVVSRVRAELGVTVPLRALFEAPTVAGMAEAVDGLLGDERAVAEGERDRVTVVSGERNLELSFAQERLWFLDQMEPGRPWYNLPVAARIVGDLDEDALERSLGEIVRRHGVLRTTFPVMGERPVQRIAEPGGPVMMISDLSDLPEDRRRAELDRLLREEALRPFDLATGPLFRARLFRLGRSGPPSAARPSGPPPPAREYALVLNTHHIVSDGWSIGILVAELGRLYAAFRAGKPSPLADPPIQYADFSAWQRRWLQGEVMRDQLTYWKGQLGGELPVLELPADRVRPAMQTYQGANRRTLLSPELTEGLRELSRREGVSLFMTLLAAFNALLHKYAGRTDIVVGTPIANRNRAETEELIGFFVNSLVLRTDLSGDPTFAEVLGRVREVALGAYDHQDLPFEVLVETLRPARALSRSPLFQVMFALQTMTPGLTLDSLEVSPVEMSLDAAKFDLTLTVAERASHLLCSFEYSTDLFEAATVDRMAAHFETLLTHVVGDSGRRLSELSLLSREEEAEIAARFAGTALDYPRGTCVHELFEEQARLAPERVALSFGEERITYGELDRMADRAAAVLRELGVGPEVPVALYLERSVEMVVGLLGVLKAGGAYVPLDPEHPPERLAFILDDTRAPVVMTQERLRERVEGLGRGAVVISLDGSWETPRAAPGKEEEEEEEEEEGRTSGAPVGPLNLAYITYTSGSTGRPKGVGIPHQGVVRLVRGAGHLAFDHRDVCLGLSPLSFDASTLELWGPLLNGGRVALMPPGRPSLEDIGGFIVSRGVTTATLTTGLFNLMVDTKVEALRGLRQLLFGGDAASVPHVRRALEELPGCRLLNGYGPTENTTDTTCFQVTEVSDGARSIPIGRPVGNTTVYILDPRLRPVPVGVPGELFTGGDGLARGYLERPDLTAECFVPDPFGARPGGRLYRTGDIVRYRADGVIEFLGRIDHQVKLRGFRVELGEIEAAMGRHPAVGEAVVVAAEDDVGDKRLIAYVVPAASGGRGGSRDPASDQETLLSIKAFLQQTLPDYMVPAAWVILEGLPLTPSGKVDRRALPAPEGTGLESAEAYAGPRTPTEEIIAGIWTELLPGERVGIHDEFFTLGGHSLLATRVVSRLRAVFGVTVPLRVIFETPTVAGLAVVVERLRRDETALAESARDRLAVRPVEGHPELSFAQERLWFLDQLEPGRPWYNLPMAVRLRGELDERALERSLGEIVRRHASLRTSFPVIDERPVQIVATAEEMVANLVEKVDLSEWPEAEREEKLRQLMAEETGRAFDLARGPLLRVRLYRLGPAAGGNRSGLGESGVDGSGGDRSGGDGSGEHVLFLNMHHIISDGWSMGVLGRELGALYAAFRDGRPSPLAELPIQYPDFSTWQRDWLGGEVLQRQLGYWKDKLTGLSPLELPTDRRRPAVQSPEGRWRAFELSPSTVRGLRKLSAREGSSLFMTLLAAFKVLLWRYSGQADIAVGSPIANRNQAEIEDLIGFFVNTLVLRTDLSGNPSFSELLSRVRETAFGAYAHQDLPFEKLVEELQPERSLSRHPLFQVMFALQNTAGEALVLEGLESSTLSAGTGSSRFDLSLHLGEDGENLRGVMVYSTGLFEDETIGRMLGHWTTLLEEIVADPGRRIGDLPLLSRAELESLAAWNRTERVYEAGRATLPELFESRVRRSPDASAVAYGGVRLTYKELDQRAERWAQRLAGLGVGPDTVVALCLERSVEMVVGLLGALKAGAGYLPLDPENPPERLGFMLRDSGAAVVLTTGKFVRMLSAEAGGKESPVPPGVPVLRLDLGDLSEETAGEETPAAVTPDPVRPPGPVCRAGPDNLAYVIYTSGSTGTPKAVMCPHRGVVNQLLWLQERYPLGPEDRVLQKTPYSFDVSVLEFFQTLMTGALLVMAEPGGHRDPEYLARVIGEHEVTLLHFVPSMLGIFLEQPGLEAACASVRRVISIGEALPAEMLARFHQRLGQATLHNLYGPAEASVTATHWDCPHDQDLETVPIGRPVANTSVHILDRSLRPVPVGVPGELHLGGVALARGYRGRPDLTAERFVPDPFAGAASAGGHDGGSRLYRTGDLGRYLPSGQIEFIGRLDHQVKLRGFRIELGEIEAVLKNHPGVADAAVVVREDFPGDQRLTAYVVPVEPADESEGRPLGELMVELRSYLHDKLPDYMVPTAWAGLAALPLNRSGKVDRTSLPVPEEAELGFAAGYVEPRTPVEKVIVGIWGELLRLERVGANDSFFDLGGHSLLATRFVARLRAVLGVTVPLRTIFEEPTVAGLAAVVEGGRKTARPTDP